jgi:hypothetical protein
MWCQWNVLEHCVNYRSSDTCRIMLSFLNRMLTTGSVTVGCGFTYLPLWSSKLLITYSCLKNTDVRLAALEAIVDYIRTDGKQDDVVYLLNILENDPVPAMKHDLCRLIIQCLSEKTVS